MLGDIIQRTIRLGCCVIRHTCKGREGQDKKAESKRAAAQVKPEETRRKGGFLCDGIRRVFLHECPHQAVRTVTHDLFWILYRNELSSQK